MPAERRSSASVVTVTALISFGPIFNRDYTCARLRLSRLRAALAWWWMSRSQRYIVLRDLVVQAPGAAIHVGLVVVSTRGLFVVEPLDAGIAHDLGSIPSREHGHLGVTDYDDPMRRCEEQAHQLARVLEENRSFVNPVLVSAGALPTDRPAHLVSGHELVDYIRSFRVEVFSGRRLQQIVAQLCSRAPAPVHADTHRPSTTSEC